MLEPADRNYSSRDAVHEERPNKTVWTWSRWNVEVHLLHIWLQRSLQRCDSQSLPRSLADLVYGVRLLLKSCSAGRLIRSRTLADYAKAAVETLTGENVSAGH